MGFLWLSTVPLTNAIVAQIFGVKYLSMLSGLVFFSHQLGSFCGAFLGGYLFDRTGSYLIVWEIAIALGVFAFLVNLPVKERAISRTVNAWSINFLYGNGCFIVSPCLSCYSFFLPTLRLTWWSPLLLKFGLCVAGNSFKNEYLIFLNFHNIDWYRIQTRRSTMDSAHAS